METENMVNDMQEQNVDAQQPEAVQGEVEQVETENTEPTEIQEEPAKPQQSREENSAIAQFRKQAEAKERALQAQNDRLLSALNQFGYEGSPEEIADALMAQTQNITVEEAKAQREATEQENQRLTQLQGENEYFKNIAIEKLMADDLAKIKSTFKDDAKVQGINSLNELGEEFVKALNVTKDPVLAYDVLRAKQARETKPTPPEIGGVNNSESKEKDYYTPEEVDKLTDKDYDNPKIMERVRQSMQKWR